jgi:integrase
VILDPADEDRDDDPSDDDTVDDEPAGEWLDGLRAAGLPVRSGRTREPREPSTAVLELVRRSKAANTHRAYLSDWIDFTAWCTATGVDDPTGVDDLDVAEYVATLVARHLAYATIQRRLSGIGWYLSANGRTRPLPTRAAGVAEVMAGAARTLGAAQRRATPLRLEPLQRILYGIRILRPHAPPEQLGRDRLLLALGWASACRPSELVALDPPDIAFHGDADHGTGGMIITVRVAKNDPTAIGGEIAVPYSTHPGTCPVRITQRWLRTHPDRPLFERIDRHGHRRGRLDTDAVGIIVRRHIITGLLQPADSYSGYSLRRGFATEARARGVADHLIAAHLRDRDLRMVQRYAAPEQHFVTPALGWSGW